MRFRVEGLGEFRDFRTLQNVGILGFRRLGDFGG